MKTIYKYPLNFTRDSGKNYTLCDILLPEGAKILHYGVQDGNITMWAEVDRDAQTEMRTFAVVPTGGDVPEDWDKNWEHQATVFMSVYVWHIYKAD